LAEFETDRIFGFDWSRDGKYLACVRGLWALNVVISGNCSGLPAALAALDFSRGFKPIGIYANYVQPNATGGSRRRDLQSLNSGKLQWV
jgi:hypothetical protein